MSNSDQLWFLAFIITPAIAVAWGYGLVLLHERSLRKDRKHPAE
jgi:hypothetical protein